MTSKTFFPHIINSVDSGKGQPNCQYKEGMDNSTINPYWPKALVTTFMMDRNKVTRVVYPKKITLIHNTKR